VWSRRNSARPSGYSSRRHAQIARTLLTCGVAFAVTCFIFAAAASAGPAQPSASGAPIALPSNLTVAPVFQPFLDSMLRSSPTFRRQFRRLVAAQDVRVVLRLEELQRRPSFDARTVLERRNGVLVAANVFLHPSPNAMELIAHEVEHVLEQLDGVDLEAHIGSGHVWVREDGAFETRRATEVGRRVAREVRLQLGASEGSR
jgi:hypothetical protein